MRVTVDITKVTKSLSKIAVNSDNAKTLLNAVAIYHLRQTLITFKNEGQREDHPQWKPFAIQYRRKTDGVTVPAWGGVPRVYGKGLVLGRKRPSGKRITQNSKLLQDTGTMRNSFQKQLLENKKVIYGSVLAYVGKHQYGLDGTPKREMLFFTQGDETTIDGMTKNFVVNEVLKV